jgi:hypothetical protein
MMSMAELRGLECLMRIRTGRATVAIWGFERLCYLAMYGCRPGLVRLPVRKRMKIDASIGIVGSTRLERR